MILTDEDGKKYEVVSVNPDGECVMRLDLHPGESIVRPLPPPAKTVEEARDALYAVVGGACMEYAVRAKYVPAVDALIAAVRAEEAAKRG